MYTFYQRGHRGFGGVVNSFPSLLSAYWVLSAYFLENKRMRLLTRVYGIGTTILQGAVFEQLGMKLYTQENNTGSN